jgi:hypothetical protein
MSNVDGITDQEGEHEEEQEGLLTVADCERPARMEIYVPAGRGLYRNIIATARPRMTFDKCADHFIANGVCIDCTQKTGVTVWAE